MIMVQERMWLPFASLAEVSGLEAFPNGTSLDLHAPSSGYMGIACGRALLLLKVSSFPAHITEGGQGE